MSVVPQRCTAQLKSGSFCDAPTFEGMPFPICARHAYQVCRAAQVADPNYEAFLRVIEPPRHRDDLTYYLRVGDHIKIGYTNNLKQRLKTYPPTAALIGLEAGNVELQRLQQFASSLTAGREWFDATQDLMDHIASLPPIAEAAA